MGDTFDIYPMGSKLPYRIDLLDAEVDSLRTFDPQTQRTVDRVEAINLLPAREYPMDRGAISRFQMNWYDSFDVDHDLCPTYVDVSFVAGEQSKQVQVPIINDTSSERIETILLKLSLPSYAVLSEPFDAVLYLFDDENSSYCSFYPGFCSKK